MIPYNLHTAKHISRKTREELCDFQIDLINLLSS